MAQRDTYHMKKKVDTDINDTYTPTQYNSNDKDITRTQILKSASYN